jgi:hypothetical protein
MHGRLNDVTLRSTLNVIVTLVSTSPTEDIFFCTTSSTTVMSTRNLPAVGTNIASPDVKRSLTFISVQKIRICEFMPLLSYFFVAWCWTLWNIVVIRGVRHPQHTQPRSNSSTIAADNSNGATYTRCCRYSCTRSWWWVELLPETCRAVFRYK